MDNNSLDRIESQLVRIESLLVKFEHFNSQAPGMIAMAGDIFEDMMASIHRDGADPHTTLENLGVVLQTVIRAVGHPETRQLFESGAFSKDAVRNTNMLARCFAAAFAKEPPRLGLIGMLKYLRDPDVQRALGLALVTAKAIGSAIPETIGQATIPAQLNPSDTAKSSEP